MFGNSLWMDNYEQLVLTFIYRRIYMYGNQWATIPYRQFTDGVWSAKLGPVTPRIAISREKLFESLRHLQGKRIIEVRPGEKLTDGNRYRIREDSEIDQATILKYVMENQGSLLHSVYRELCKNKKYLPPAYNELLDAIKKEYQRKTAFTRKRNAHPVTQRRMSHSIDAVMQQNREYRALQRNTDLVSLPTNGWSAGRPTDGPITDHLNIPIRHSLPNRQLSTVPEGSGTGVRVFSKGRKIVIPKKDT